MAMSLDDRRARILFVDDEERILRSMRTLFKRDYDVWDTPDPTKAVDIVKDNDIDVVVSDQRMPHKTGIELLREVKQVAPRTMRVLLTGYADLQATLDAINEGEVFRYINKPWSNDELKSVVAAAAKVARENLLEKDGAVSDEENGVLVIDDDPQTQTFIKEEVIKGEYPVYCVSDMESAMAVLEEHEIGVIVSETQIGSGDVTSLIKVLKATHPHIVTIVASKASDAQMAIRLINHGQIFRFLPKPLVSGLCRVSIDSARKRYTNFKHNPQVVERYQVDKKTLVETTEALPTGLIGRIKAIRNRFFGLASHA